MTFRSRLGMWSNEVKMLFGSAQLFSCMFSGESRSLRAPWTRKKSGRKTRLQLNIDPLTLFPAAAFLPLPKQTRVIYFLGYSRVEPGREELTCLPGHTWDPWRHHQRLVFVFYPTKMKENEDETTMFDAWPIITFIILAIKCFDGKVQSTLQ